MKLPPFQDYLSTITTEQMSSIEARIENNICLTTRASSACAEDITLAYATAISIEFLSYYHAWLTRFLDPIDQPPAS